MTSPCFSRTNSRSLLFNSAVNHDGVVGSNWSFATVTSLVARREEKM
jgi:hypothetical protein